MKLIFSSILLLILGATGVFSQNPAPVLRDNTITTNTDETYKVDDVRGNIKRRAIYLPKPIYPREAIEAGADGTVRVEIVLGGDGRVISAKALSGHPLLLPAAEETARKTIFRKSETTDPTDTETGVIVYGFAIEKEGWVKIGYDLTVVQKIPTLRILAVPRIAKAFPTDWTGEHEILGKLAEMRRAEIEANNSPENKPVFVRRPTATPNGPLPAIVTSEIRVQVPIPNPPTPERIALAQNLTASLVSRLAVEESNLWKFNLGINAAKALEISRVPNQGRSAAQLLRQSLETAPAAIPVESLTPLKKLIEIFESEARTVETRNEIGRLLTGVFGIK